MKGPGERLKYDLRRVWECPACHHRERSDGSETYRYCGCQAKLPVAARRVMKLAEDGVRRRTPLVMPKLVVEADADAESPDRHCFSEDSEAVAPRLSRAAPCPTDEPPAEPTVEQPEEVISIPFPDGAS